MTTTLTLTKVFVNLMSSGAAVSAQSAPGRAEKYEMAGETRTYAGGRRRSITIAGEVGTYTFVLRLAVRADIETLRNWIGSTVEVRDHKGRRFFGTYYQIEIAEYRDALFWDVGITLSVVTTDEGV